MRVKNTREATRRALLAAEHHTLEKRVAALRLLLEGEFSWDAARIALSELRQALEAHFFLEESGGYLSAVLALAPERNLAVARLESDHSRMQGGLAALLCEALLARSREELRTNVSAFLGVLADHERRENELVQSTFSSEVSAGD